MDVDDIVEEVSGATKERLSPAHIHPITHHDFREILKITHPSFVIGTSAYRTFHFVLLFPKGYHFFRDSVVARDCPNALMSFMYVMCTDWTKSIW